MTQTVMVLSVRAPERRSEQEKPLMLIIARKRGEQIVIGRNIEIVVLGISHSRVKLGIEASNDVSTWRKELTYRVSRSSSKKPR
jgi:carbon storage regulator